MELVGEKLGNDLMELGKYENLFAEGDKGELRLYVSQPLTQYEIDKIGYELISQGVTLIEPITQDARVVSIKFEKRIAPLLIIGGIIAAIVVGLLGWQVFKVTQWGVPLWVILIGGGALLYLLLRKPVAKAMPLAIQAGKVYVTRRVASG